MYPRGVAIQPFRYLFKVRRIKARNFSGSVLVRNLSTATQTSDFSREWNENYVSHGNFTQGERLTGFEPDENTNRAYRKVSNVNYDDSPIRGVVNNAEARSYGLDRRRHSEFTERNGHAQNLEAQRGVFSDGNVWTNSSHYAVQKNENFSGVDNGRSSSNIGDSYCGNSSIAWKPSYFSETYQQHGNGVTYSNNAVNSQKYSGESYGYVEQQGSANAEVQSSDSFTDTPLGVEKLDEFIRDRKLKDAIEFLEHLQKESIQVDLPRYMALIAACGEKQALEQAKSIHQHLLQSMPHLDVRTYNRILEMYVNCGSVEDLFAVFDRMAARNLTSWDIMISGLAKLGHGEDSILLYDEFKQCGLKPDGEMFLGIFSACGAVCDTVEGMLHFESMKKDYGIIPTMKHYITIVDMLGSAGCLDGALEFIHNIPIDPGIDIWKALMKWSRIHGDTELGDRCAEIVELMDPSGLDEESRSGLIHVDAADIEREKEKKKQNGQNLLDMRSRVHEYRAGDRSHPDHEKIYALLRGMKQQMKELGYVPETKFVLHDVDPESKEEALMAHSERLAAAQGLMTSAARSPMRIIKNLRVCGDCHNAFKIISKLVGREIIARDSKRFHHFRDGSCSCNDYW